MKLQIKNYLAVLSLILSIVILTTACSSSVKSYPIPQEEERLRQDTSLQVMTSAQSNLPGFEPALENESLRLYINKTTAEIAVVEKKNNKVWYSNPQDRNEDNISPYLKGKLGAQLSFVYLAQNGQNKDYDSANDSVKYEQFEIETTDTGLTVTYHFGNPAKGLEITPKRISAERMDMYLSKLEDPKDQDQLKNVRYKFLKDENVYERREIGEALIPRVLGIFEKIGYTEEDLVTDNEENGIETEIASNPRFTVPIHYTLNGSDFIASVDTRSIIEQSSDYRISQINLLENFGAAGKEEEGYILLPDGSGSLLTLNNKKLLAQPILIPIYGEDGSISVSEKFNVFQTSRLPVFGMKTNKSAFFAIIEQGEALAKLSADISGRLNSYNTVGAQFTVLPKDEVKLSADEIMYKTPKKSYLGKLQVRYTFLDGEDADYSGMAAYYREYLEQFYGLTKLASGGEAPFYLELSGSFPKEKSFLGIPYEGLYPLTRINDASFIVDSLKGEQINNIRVNYKGWFNRGLNHEYPVDVKMDGLLGSLKEWQALADKLKESGGGLYPDAALLQVYEKSNGYSTTKDSAQTIARRYIRVHEYNRANYQRLFFSHYLISPNRLNETVGEFLKDYDKYNPGAISLRDLGTSLHSDHRLNAEVTREATKQIVTEQVKRIYEQAPDIMVNGGNAYVLPHTSHIINAPQSSNEFQLAGESVPFYQMVLHGYIDYAGQPFNLADDQDVKLNILRSLETGSNVYYSWIYEDGSELKETSYSSLYSNHYEKWYSEAVSAYHEVNAVLKQVRGESIKKHEKLADEVYRTQYENGISVIVNYSDAPFTVNGVTIEAMNYSIEGGVQ